MTPERIAELRRLLEAVDKVDADAVDCGSYYHIRSDTYEAMREVLHNMESNAADELLRAAEDRNKTEASLLEVCEAFGQGDSDYVVWTMRRRGLWREAPKAGE